MHRFLVATLSYLPDTLRNLDKRISFYKTQLRWLESLGIDFEYIRVESDWGQVAKSDPELVPNLKYSSIVTGPNPCGCNRSLILDRFYETDYDWLVCLDDDRILYPHYSPRDFLLDLDTAPFQSLAKRGYLIVCLDPIYMPFKKDNYLWKYHETHWRLETENPHGCLQVCFIPNLKKYGYTPIYFDRTTRAQMDEAPEDYKFEIDWLVAKHPIIKCTNLIMKETGQSAGDGSTIYRDLEHRKQVEATQGAWYSRYIRQVLPRRPELWGKKELVRRRNPKFIELIPRSIPYVFSDSEIPKLD